MRYAFLLIPLAALLVVACSGGGGQTQPTPSPAPPPTVVLPSPAAEPTPTPTPEPALQRIAYIATDGDVWIINADGSGERRLFDVPRVPPRFPVHEIQWAPDGSKFAAVAEAESMVYIVSAAGGKLLEVPAEFFLTWSPGSDMFVVARGLTFEMGPSILVLDLEGSTVAEFPAISLSEPSFSSDGRRIAFLQVAGPGGLCEEVRGVVADLRSGEVKPIDPDEEPVSCGNGLPLFSPTNPSSLAYTNRIFNLDTGQEIPLPGDAVDWSPDGQLLTMCERHSGGRALVFDVLNTASILEFDYTPAPDGPCWAHLSGLTAWSPDTHILASFDNAGVLNVRNLDAGDETTLHTVGDRGRASPQFAPDGALVAFHICEPPPDFGRCSDRVYVVNVDGTNLTLLAEGIAPVWQPQP